MVDKKQQWAVVGGVTIALVLLGAYLLSVFTNFTIDTYALVFFPMLGVAFYLVLKIGKFLNSGERLNLENVVLLAAIAVAVGFFFTQGKAIWPEFSIIARNLLGAL